MELEAALADIVRRHLPAGTPQDLLRPMVWDAQGGLLDPDLPEPLVVQLAEEVLNDLAFRSLQLGRMLDSEAGELIARAVGLVILPAHRFQYHLAVAVLRRAASIEREQGQKAARRFLVGAAAAAVVVAALLRTG